MWFDTLMSVILIVGFLGLGLIVALLLVGFILARDRSERMVQDDQQEKLRQAMRKPRK